MTSSVPPVPPVSAVADVLVLHGLDGWLTPPLSTVVPASEPTWLMARTVLLEEADSGPGLAVLYELLSDDLTGVALVIAGAADIGGAVWGEILSRAARLAGASAVLVDGAVRDRAAMAAEGLAVFARRQVVVGPNGRAHAIAIDVPVMVGDVSVRRGDAVVIDASGAARIEAEHADGVIDDAKRYAAAEEQLLEALAAGQPMSTAYRIKRHAVQELQRTPRGVSTRARGGRHIDPG